MLSFHRNNLIAHRYDSQSRPPVYKVSQREKREKELLQYNVRLVEDAKDLTDKLAVRKCRAFENIRSWLDRGRAV